MLPAADASAACPPCRFGRFELHPAERRLLADDKVVALGARAFDLLVVLVARAGHLVSKNELLTLVWSGLVVEENNLQVQISALRKLLGPNAVATIPGRGYRFEMPVEVVADAAATASARSATDGAATTVESAQRAADARDQQLRREAAGGAVLPQRAPTNLASRLASLYGRADDLSAVRSLVQQHTVVTIAGAGGIGKTRVAQAVAAELAAEHAPDYPDGVWWIELAPLAAGAHVASAVARMVGTQLGADRPPLDTLAAVMAPKRLLLVLDNCEHVADAVAALVDAVCAAAPGVRILATSQETLKTGDEHVYRLGALAVPAGGDHADARDSGAVALFAARAEAVDPRFVLTAENTPAIVEICRRLDGIPLAIELAAARLPLLGVEGLRARLDERFSVLTAGSRMVLRRHQTLRAALEWSHGLLTPDQQTVFRRLGVFAGSFTLEAAQHVAQGGAIDEWSALDHLGGLIDKSLVLAEGDPIPRYRLLETARAYALERLAEAGETSPVMRRHAEALLRLVTGFDAEDLAAPTTVDGLRAAAAEVDNLRAALTWAARPDGDGDLAVGLIAHSYRVWRGSGSVSEGLDRGLALRGKLRDGLSPGLVARFWLGIANLGLYTSRRDAYDAARRAADAFRALDEPLLLFDALVRTAIQGVRFGSIEDMGAAIAEAERLVRPDSPAMLLVRLEFARSRWFARQGRMEESLAAAERQCAIARDSGHELSALYGISNVVAAQIELGDTELGLTRARQAIARLEELGASVGSGHLWLGVAMGEALLGNVDTALAACRTAYTLLLTEADQLRIFPMCALCAALQGRFDDAARVYGFVDAVVERAGSLPESHWRRVRDRVDSLLAAKLSPEGRAQLAAEGAATREEDVFRMGVGDAAPRRSRSASR
jgi:predicted ATPase/DNA-binding winged helix-turn-helix (wHTH) protein